MLCAVRVTIAAGKGGTGKTTTAMLTAFALVARGSRVLVVDVDQQQQSCLTWQALAVGEGYEWPASLAVVAWSRSIERTFDEHDHVLFDCGPRRTDLAREAARRSDALVVPSGPRPADLAELAPIAAAVAELASAGHVIVWGVLLNFVRLGTAAALQAPALVESAGWPLLRTKVPLRESIALAFGTVPPVMGVYLDLARELEEAINHADASRPAALDR